MANTKKRVSRPKVSKNVTAPQVVAIHDFGDLLRAVSTSKPKLVGDCLRNCLPARAFTVISQFGELLTDAGVGGDRVLNQARAELYADLLVDAFQYDKDAVLAQISNAVNDWNAANKDENGYPVPFI